MYTTTSTVQAQIPSVRSSVCQNSSEPYSIAIACGMRATIPAMMISEAPFPTPNSVMSSPSHITSSAPGHQRQHDHEPEREGVLAHALGDHRRVGEEHAGVHEQALG
jgi:hypothetical protein